MTDTTKTDAQLLYELLEEYDVIHHTPDLTAAQFDAAVRLHNLGFGLPEYIEDQLVQRYIDFLVVRMRLSVSA